MQAIQNLLTEEQRRIVHQILADLPPRAGCVALIGELGMGKTSVLQTLKESVAGNQAHKALYVYISLEDVDEEEAFCDAILEELYIMEKNGEKEVMLQTGSDVWERLDAAVDKLAGHLVSLTIVVDDADLLEFYDWGAKLFRRLTSLLNKDAPVYIILAGTEKLVLWAERLPGKKGLWEYLAQSPIRLGAISIRKVEDALFDTEFARRIVELCGGHPYCLSRVTENISDNNSMDFMVNALDLEVRQLQQTYEWEEIFHSYWESYSIFSRQICYLLFMNSLGFKRDELKTMLASGNTTAGDVETAIRNLEWTGILVQDEPDGRLRLINIFRTWYQYETGYMENRRSLHEHSIPAMTAAGQDRPLTELIFLPDEKSVLVKRGHFFFRSDLGIDPKFLSRYSRKCDKSPAAKLDEFADNLNELTQDLWVAFGDKEWLTEVRESSRDHCVIRFYFPSGMMGFPFELLPLDDTGTRRIGTQVPISRQLFGQGRSVNREPLSLPLPSDRRLKILVVLAETRGDFWIDSNGNAQPGKSPYEVGAPVFGQLRLDDDVNVLYQAFNGRSDSIEQVTFLCNQSLQENWIRRLPPSMKAFEEALAENKFDLIHFAGHGLFSNILNGLVFPEGLMPLNKLLGLLERQDQLRFVYLSCCESARMLTDEFDSNLLGLAQTCIEAGVPAVLSMRWPIPAGVSRQLSERFYPAFLQSGILEQATLDAIKSLSQLSKEFSVYAAAPVLLRH